VPTDVRADLNPNYKWVKTSGIISRDKWGNLPGGEIFTSPGEVNGTYVVDGVVGDYLCAHYGLLNATPLTIHIKGNRIVSLPLREPGTAGGVLGLYAYR
jgi:aminopeptidase